MTRALSPPGNSPPHDLVMTPSALARSIVDRLAPSGLMMDPCRGDGAFYQAMRRRRSGTVSWCELSEGRDFLAPETHARCDWIITNPPWSKFRPFLVRAMEMSDEVVFLATLTHFVTRARLADIRAAGFGFRTVIPVTQPGPPWPSSGFQLAAVRLTKGYEEGPTTFDWSLTGKGTT